MDPRKSATGALYGIFITTFLGLLLMTVTLTFLINNKEKNEDISVSSIQTADASDEIQKTLEVELLPVEDPKTISTSEGIIISIGQSYEVMSRFGSTVGTPFECLGEKCEIFEIYSSSEENYYISIGSEINHTANQIGSYDQRSIGGYNLNTEFYWPFEGEEMIRQLYGCIAENICIHSGLLYVDDVDINKSELNEFIQFLNTLQINNG